MALQKIDASITCSPLIGLEITGKGLYFDNDCTYTSSDERFDQEKQLVKARNSTSHG